MNVAGLIFSNRQRMNMLRDLLTPHVGSVEMKSRHDDCLQWPFDYSQWLETTCRVHGSQKAEGVCSKIEASMNVLVNAIDDAFHVSFHDSILVRVRKSGPFSDVKAMCIVPGNPTSKILEFDLNIRNDAHDYYVSLQVFANKNHIMEAA